MMQNGALILTAVGMLTMATEGFGQLPGNATVSIKPNGEREVCVTPGWLTGKNRREPTPKLGGTWTDKSPTNFLLEAVLHGGGSLEKLRITNDGKVSELSPSAAPAQSGYNQYLKAATSSRRFEVSLDFVKQMVAGTNVMVEFGDGKTFTAANFSSEVDGGKAKTGFKQALQMIASGAMPTPVVRGSAYGKRPQ
jgi:hypothetical protein